MLIRSVQDDLSYFVASAACAVLLFLFMITARKRDQELRKPFIALLVAIIAGLVIAISKAIPILVIGVLCLGLLITIVRNVVQLQDVSHLSIQYSTQSELHPKPQPETTKQASANSAQQKTLESLKSLWPMLSIFAVMGFFCLMYMMLNKNSGISLIGSVRSMPSSSITSSNTTTSKTAPITPVTLVTTPTATQTAIPTTTAQKEAVENKAVENKAVENKAVENKAVENKAASNQAENLEKADVQHQVALQSYQQVKINHQASIHTVDAEWAHLLKNTSKNHLGIWLKSQQNWMHSKKHVCGSVSDIQDIHQVSTAKLNLEIKILHCDTEANLNRASYIKDSATAMIHGSQPKDDDLGHLIHNLSKP